MWKAMIVSGALLTAAWQEAAGKEAAAIADTPYFSTELSSDMQPSQFYFPLGMLGDRNFDQLPAIGFNLTEDAHCCYDFIEGRDCPGAGSSEVENGLFFYNIWAAHSLWHHGNKPGEPFRKAQRPDGSFYGGPWINYFHQPTRQRVLECAAASVEHVLRGNAKIWKWGIDNEYEAQLDYSPEARAAFLAYLADAYQQDIANLNRCWQSNYADFSEVELPRPEERLEKPAAWLDFRQFHEEAFTDFLVEYFQAIRNADPLKRDVISKSTQCSLEMTYVARNRINNQAMLAEKTRRLSNGWYGIDMYGHNDRDIYEVNYLFNAMRPTDAQKASGAPEAKIFTAECNNHAGPGRQFAETFWRYAANGGKGFNFFVMGSFQAENDYSTFSFIDASDGQPRDRLFYAARLATMIHRTEPFWSECLPVQSAAGKAAILMPQRDVQLSADTNRSWWDYGVNSRLTVFSRLRDLGYFVDILPYTKLDPAYLKRYQALLLVSADHLTRAECQAIEQYVADGGVLLADTQAGYFDERHRIQHGLDRVLGIDLQGVYQGIHFSPDDVWYANENGFVLRSDGRINATLDGAELVNAVDVKRNAKSAWLTRHDYGKGQAYWFSTKLGALRAESTPDRAVSDFLGDILAAAGVRPAYQLEGASAEQLRLEAPLADSQGNLMLIAASNSTEPVQPCRLTLALPETPFASVWLAPADNNWLLPVAYTRRPDGRLTLELPEIQSAAAIYLFSSAAPFLGIRTENSGTAAKNDPNTPLLAPGQPATVTVQIVNPVATAWPGGRLTLAAAPGWRVEPQQHEIRQLAAGEQTSVSFTVTPPADLTGRPPLKIDPLLAQLAGRDGNVIATVNQTAMLQFDPVRYASLLSDNKPAGALSAHYLATGATYSVECSGGWTDGRSFRDPRDGGKPNVPGRGLLSGVRNDWNVINDILFEGVPEATVQFDLQRDYLLTELKIGRGSSDGLAAVEISFSRDGQTFADAMTLDGSQLGTEPQAVSLADIDARFVKLKLTFPGQTGTLGAVEIYGKAKSADK